MQDVFGDFDPKSDDPIVGIREMVFQMRNAFAHRPWRTRWRIKAQHQGVFPVVLDAESRFDFDTRALDGQRIKPDDVGGFEFWIRLIQHCRALIDRQTSAP